MDTVKVEVVIEKNQEVYWDSEIKQSEYLSTLEQKEPKLHPEVAKYSSTYFQSFLKPLKALVDSVKWDFSSDMPMKITAELSRIKIRYWLAPRIEVD
jgi:hypothetical protein